MEKLLKERGYNKLDTLLLIYLLTPESKKTCKHCNKYLFKDKSLVLISIFGQEEILHLNCAKSLYPNRTEIPQSAVYSLIPQKCSNCKKNFTGGCKNWELLCSACEYIPSDWICKMCKVENIKTDDRCECCGEPKLTISEEIKLKKN